MGSLFIIVKGSTLINKIRLHSLMGRIISDQYKSVKFVGINCNFTVIVLQKEIVYNSYRNNLSIKRA